MLFNSPEFIFIFIPSVLIVLYFLGRWKAVAALVWLTLASLVFYSYWNIRYLPLLCISILINYGFGMAIVTSRRKNRKNVAKAWLILGISVDLLLLGYFKYAHFVLGIVNDLFHFHISLPAIVLPLGISFFTFTQIAYLVDAHRGQVHEHEYSFPNYSLFVTYFPHLIAGPIIHHKEMMPQFKECFSGSRYSIHSSCLALGLTIFALGLFKKTIFADSMGSMADPVFLMAGKGVIRNSDAWGGALAYTLQIYFDFSGYSDMAIGLSWMIGIRLPLNFYSPYRSTSIIEFWQRWHMTLSRFLKDYLYIPLGGNRKGTARKHLNLLLTMLLGGLWHGAIWTFVAWGALHGIFLMVNHVWRQALVYNPGFATGLIRRGRFDRKMPVTSARTRSVDRFRKWGEQQLLTLLTFTCVTVAWVFFRAENMRTAWNLFGSMLHFAPQLYTHARLLTRFSWFGIGLLLLVVFEFPNIYEILGGESPALPHPLMKRGKNCAASRWSWKPSPAWAIASAAIFAVCILILVIAGETPQFLYFQF